MRGRTKKRTYQAHAARLCRSEAFRIHGVAMTRPSLGSQPVRLRRIAPTMRQPAVRPVQRIPALPHLQHVVHGPTHGMRAREFLIDPSMTQPAVRLLGKDLSLDLPPCRACTSLAVGHGYLHWLVAQAGLWGGGAAGQGGGRWCSGGRHRAARSTASRRPTGGCCPGGHGCGGCWCRAVPGAGTSTQHQGHGECGRGEGTPNHCAPSAGSVP